MAYCVVRTDNLHGTINGADLCAFKFYNGTAYAAIENGNVVALDAYLGDDVWKAVKPTAKQALGKLALVAGVELFKDREKPLEEFINPADAIVRGYILKQGDIFSVTAEGLEGTADLTTNKYIQIQAKTTFLVDDEATDAVAELIAIDDVDALTYYVYRVL